ncbi:MAG: tol-pal system YbgF family protein [Myxococcota bacterium]
MRWTSGADRAEFRVARLLRGVCLAVVALAGAACSGASSSDAARDAASAGVAPIVARAAAAAASGDLDAAVDGYSEAIERTPWNTRLRSQLVAAHTERAEQKRRKPGGPVGLAAAEKDLRAAHALAPDDAVVTRSLAAILVERAAFEADDALAAALRAEGVRLAPELAEQTPAVRLPIEQRLDLAYDLIEQGNVDAGIDQLHTVVREYPQNAQAARMLAQALVRLGNQQTEVHDYDGAQQSFSEAVEQYARLLPCDGTRCDSAELELAHRDRILSALDAQRIDLARAALAEAQGLGMNFDDLLKRWPELRAAP